MPNLLEMQFCTNDIWLHAILLHGKSLITGQTSLFVLPILCENSHHLINLDHFNHFDNVDHFNNLLSITYMAHFTKNAVILCCNHRTKQGEYRPTVQVFVMFCSNAPMIKLYICVLTLILCLHSYLFDYVTFAFAKNINIARLTGQHCYTTFYSCFNDFSMWYLILWVPNRTCIDFIF